MTSHFEEECFFLGEKSNRMVTVTPFMGKVSVHILQFYVNGNGDMKPGKSGITLELKEFEELVKLIPKVQDSIARHELRDTGIPSSPLELDLPVLDLDTAFLPSLPSQEPFPMIRDKELLDSQPKFPSPPPSFLPSLPPLVVPSLENIDVNSPKEPKEKRKRAMKHRKRAKRSQRLLSLNVLTRLLPWRPSKK